MDKNIEAEVISKRKRKIIYIIIFTFVAIIATAFLLRSSFSTSLKKSSIITAVVEKGDMENTLNASGEILPEFEEVITSPINASIKSITKDAGVEVKAGESILVLDKSSSQSEYEKLKFGLESKQNDISKLKLQLDKSFYDIKSNNNIKELRITSLEADVENAKRLFKAGGGTREDVEQAELNLKVAKLEKQQLENEIRNKQQTMQVEMKEAQIAAAIQQNDLRDLERKLQQADIIASRNGVVTWVNKNIGSSINPGEALARIANLSSFKVQGSISDMYLDQIKNGMPAIVRINEQQIRGTVTNIQPSVQNGIVTFNIQLDESSNKMLRPNLKVDVFVVTSFKKDVLRVANGPAFKGASVQDIFILKSNKAERKSVHIGMSNFDFVEITDKVKEGDVIITSDMSQYKNSKEITITN